MLFLINSTNCQGPRRLPYHIKLFNIIKCTHFSFSYPLSRFHNIYPLAQSRGTQSRLTNASLYILLLFSPSSKLAVKTPLFPLDSLYGNRNHRTSSWFSCLPAGFKRSRTNETFSRNNSCQRINSGPLENRESIRLHTDTHADKKLSRPASGVNLFTNYFKYVAQSVFVKQKLVCVQTSF